MANTRQAKKRILINDRKRQRNKAYMSAVKTYIKKARTAIESGAGDASDQVKTAVSFIDKAASKGIIHRNTAARRKSKLARKLNRENAS